MVFLNIQLKTQLHILMCTLHLVCIIITKSGKTKIHQKKSKTGVTTWKKDLYFHLSEENLWVKMQQKLAPLHDYGDAGDLDVSTMLMESAVKGVSENWKRRCSFDGVEGEQLLSPVIKHTKPASKINTP